MATFNKFNSFVEELAKGAHHLHAAGNQVKVYLTNNAPNAASHAGKGDLAGITEQNGYAAADIQNDVSRTGGVLTVTGVDVEWTASGAVGPFQYAVLYNEDHGSDALIGWWNYGSSISLSAGEKFKVDFGASIFTLE
jgi:ribosomal protein S11